MIEYWLMIWHNFCDQNYAQSEHSHISSVLVFSNVSFASDTQTT